MVRRGFPDEVRLTLAQLVGGRCPHCDVGPGVRRYPTHGGDWIEDDCNECGGLGTLPGAAAGLGRLPLTRIVLTDREPRLGSVDQGMWLWPDSDRLRANPASLTWDLMMLLTDPDNRMAKVYPTRDDALAALSAACIAYTRAAAATPAGSPA